MDYRSGKEQWRERKARDGVSSSYGCMPVVERASEHDVPVARACEGNRVGPSADRRTMSGREFQLEAIMQLFRFRG